MATVDLPDVLTVEDVETDLDDGSLDNPWQAVFLHEVAHNLQADLGLWHENQTAVTNRMVGSVRDPLVSTMFRRWHKEIFADLAAVLLGGPVSAAGMMNFLSHPSPRVLT